MYWNSLNGIGVIWIYKGLVEFFSEFIQNSDFVQGSYQIIFFIILMKIGLLGFIVLIVVIFNKLYFFRDIYFIQGYKFIFKRYIQQLYDVL